MNEDQLKELWKNEVAKDKPIINFKRIQKEMINWKGKLRRKIELGFLMSTFLLIIYVALCAIVYIKGFYILPALIVIYVWHHREYWQVYRDETEARETTSTKVYLEENAKKLKHFIRRYRIVTLVFALPYTLYVFIAFGLFESQEKEFYELNSFLNFQYSIYTSILLCLFLSVFLVIYVEIAMRYIFLRALDDINELLKELEDE